MVFVVHVVRFRLGLVPSNWPGRWKREPALVSGFLTSFCVTWSNLVPRKINEVWWFVILLASQMFFVT